MISQKAVGLQKTEDDDDVWMDGPNITMVMQRTQYDTHRQTSMRSHSVCSVVTELVD